jgi:geranylgeranyl pyrophosphate synthase
MKSRIMSGEAVVKRLFSSVGHTGGKRIRPILVLLSAEAGGGSVEQGIKVAASAEMVHLATLLHDDVIDNSTLRRGEPTLHSIWGNKVAVLGGDYLFARAFDLLVEVGDLRLLQSMAGMIAGMGEGEILQIFFAYDPSTAEADYYERIRRKTAWFMSTCCEMGALLGELSQVQVTALSEYGTSVGIAFQVMDDLLDFIGDRETVGKPVGSDLLEGNVTLPVIHALRGAHGDEIREIIRRRQIGPEEASHIADIVREEGSLEYAYAAATKYVQSAQKALRELPAGEAATCLADLADYVINRNW